MVIKRGGARPLAMKLGERRREEWEDSFEMWERGGVTRAQGYFALYS